MPGRSEESWPSAQHPSYFQEACQLDFTEQAQVPSLKMPWAPENLGEGSWRWGHRCHPRSRWNPVREGGGCTNPNNLFIQFSLTQ